MSLFMVAILSQPTDDEQAKGAKEKLIMAPVPIIAEDGQSAALKGLLQYKESLGIVEGVTREKGEDLDTDKLDVQVSPFV